MSGSIARIAIAPHLLWRRLIWLFSSFDFSSMHRLPTSIRPLLALMLAGLLTSLQGCAVVAVADAAVTVVATGVSVAAKTVGFVADVVIPDGD